MPFKNKQKNREYQREWSKTPLGRETYTRLARERHQRMRTTALETLGGKCVHCGFNNPKALQIDHIKGDGAIERLSGKKELCREVIRSFLAGENKYQLLCANCNWIKREDNEEYKSYEKRK